MAQIIVPVDLKAMSDFDINLAKDSQLIKLFYKDGDSQFNKLWNSGVFNRINLEANTLIDLYEEEGIEDISTIERVLNGNTFELDIYEDSVKENISKLKEMFKEAFDRKTAIYFYF